MQQGTVLADSTRLSLTFKRLSHQLIENHGDFSNSCLIGIQPRGSALSTRLVQELAELNVTNIQHGKLDITFYRDDYKARSKPLSASVTEMDFIVEGKKVILVDDVLYTGRTVTAALTALLDYGRPDSVELLILVDRRFNREVPIKADYTGIFLDAPYKEYVRVEWANIEGTDQVLLFPAKDEEI